MEISKQIAAYKDEVVELRRDFHQHPELGLEEFRTSEKASEYLKQLGLEAKRANQTGVVGFLRGKEPGRTLLLRADMDALPIQEENNVPYKSIYNGKMHACGHDAHMAMLMVAAKILSNVKHRLRGNIKFVFEPNEENVGALAMIKEGVLEAPKVDACMGMHVWSPLETGKIGITPGPVLAGMEHFQILIKGKAGHTATPQSAIDPILTAASVIQGVQIIQTREIDALKEPTVIMFGKIEGGSASNVIPDKVTLSGTMRSLYEGSEDSEDNPKRRLERIVSSICSAHRATCEISFLYGHPTLVNNHEMSDLVRSVAVEDLSCKQVIVSLTSLAGDDFSEFAARVPGVFYFLGVGNLEKETHFPHHHPRFNIDEDALKVGVEMHVRAALRYLNM